MTQWAIIDTGPLVGMLDATDQHHGWAVAAFRRVRGPLITCEPVITEALYILRFLPVAQAKVLEWVEKGSLSLPFVLSSEARNVNALLHKYRDLPMSLADACLVRMAELYEKHAIFTLDSHFTIYRKYGKEPLKLVFPREG